LLANRLLDFQLTRPIGRGNRADELEQGRRQIAAQLRCPFRQGSGVAGARNDTRRPLANTETVLTINRNWAGAIFALAWCKFHTGSIDEAIPLLGATYPPQPRDPYMGIWYARIGIAHLLQSRLDEAIAWLEKARSALPSRPWTRSSLAVAYAHKGETALAAAEIAEAQRLSPDGRYSSIARLEDGGYWGYKDPTLYETIYLSGTAKRGCRKE